MAELVFRGQALDGETENGVLLSPAQFRVTEYLKGSGPDELPVETGHSPGAGSSLGIKAAPGETWLIYGDLEDGRVVTTVCAGSRPA
jgi:hypothetical protein